MSVSIHAPTRGATIDNGLVLLAVIPVSIHAPTRGATRLQDDEEALSRMFQSTHPHGVRLPVLGRMRRVTKRFNPRTHTGCDLRLALNADVPNSFNPRTHTGCDDAEKFQDWVCDVSIHAPTRGATLCVTWLIPSRSFNPRTHTGCDFFTAFDTQGPKRSFNPRTHTGCDG